MTALRAVWRWLVAAFVSLTIAGCASAKPIVVGVLDLSDAVCDQIEGPDEPDWVNFSCTAVDVAQGVSHAFKARVRRVDAAALAARRCTPQEGGVAP